MKIQEAINIINMQINNNDSRTGSLLSETDIERLRLALDGLEGIKNDSLQKGNLPVEFKLATIISNTPYTAARVIEIDGLVTEWRKRRDNNNKLKSKELKTRFSLGDFIPIVISVIILAVGLGLGLTVFKENKDDLYFALEIIKDIILSVITWIVSKQVVNRGRGKKNNAAIVIISSICGFLAFLFSLVLWLGSSMAIIERFTQWGKLTYLWLVFTFLIVEIICAVSVVWCLLTYRSRERDK